MDKPNQFITFEGIEGSGKSTQIEKVADCFRGQGGDVLVTREPGGTALGESIRDILLNSNGLIQSDFTEIMLFSADRLEHISQVIQPALDAGKVVLCDRYTDSTFAYQYGGRQLPKEQVMMFIEMAACVPDLTLVLDLPVDEGLKRAKSRAALDRFEKEDLDFHERVRQGYLEMAQIESERVNVIDVMDKDVDAVFEQILKII